jgi:hypothetical protein
MKTCLGDTHSPNLHLFSSQPLSKFSDNSNPPPSACASCYRRLVAANIERKTAPSGLRSWPLTIRRRRRRPLGIRHNSVLSSQCSKSNIQHPTSSLQHYLSHQRIVHVQQQPWHHKGMPRRHLLTARCSRAILPPTWDVSSERLNA